MTRKNNKYLFFKTNQPDYNSDNPQFNFMDNEGGMTQKSLKELKQSKLLPNDFIFSLEPHQDDLGEIGCFVNKVINPVIKTIKFPFKSDKITEIYSGYLKNPQSYLDNLFIKDMGKYGLGVFANKDFNEEEIVCFYIGRYLVWQDVVDSLISLGLVDENGNLDSKVKEKYDKSKDSHYVIALPTNQTLETKNIFGENLSIDPKYHGSLGGRMQSLPSNHFLKRHQLDNNNDIAVENVSRKLQMIDYNDQKIPIVLLTATKKIEKGDMLGFEYLIGEYAQKTTEGQVAIFSKKGEFITEVTETNNLMLDPNQCGLF